MAAASDAPGGAPPVSVIAPASLAELFARWERQPEARVFSGGLRACGPPRDARFVLPPALFSLDRVPEARRASRADRYVEAGAALSLESLLSRLPALPGLLRDLLLSSETLPVRAAIPLSALVAPEEPGPDAVPGAGVFRALRAGFLALGATCELRTIDGGRWVPARRLWAGSAGGFAFRERETLIRVRVPLEKWDWTLWRRFPAPRARDESYGVFLARVQHGALEEARVLLSGPALAADLDNRSRLAGARLPLKSAAAAAAGAFWREELRARPGLNDFLKQRFLNFLRAALANFAG